MNNNGRNSSSLGIRCTWSPIINWLAVSCLAVCSFGSVATAAVPMVLDDQWRIELVSAEPHLVTPTGCCFDDRGRLLVVECNTHFAPEGYDRADHDRIYLFEDTSGDGKLNQQSLFYDAGVATMNIANLGNGWIAVVTRSDVKRIRDADGDNVAEQIETLLTLDTEATYPHNGLGGLAFGSAGWLYVGQGENFGEPYTLTAADDTRQIGGGEGGNIFKIRPDGSDLQRVATGFWNPFGICVDNAKRIWTVGNDPDAMPPCRLLHVVEAGDYGFQFRFGRAGIHPLQAWNGELPGTLPMAAGTGEATCAVVEYDDALWVTSWGDNRIERYQMVPNGASWTGRTEVVVQGDANFRPTGMAVAPDGSIYFADWVDRSYPVHGKGRLWRLVPKNKRTAQLSMPELTAAENRANNLSVDRSLTITERLKGLEDSDPFTRQAAVAGLVRTNVLQVLDWESADSGAQQLGILLSLRWREMIDPKSLAAAERDSWIFNGLASDDPAVVLAAVRWATERDSKQHLDTIRQVLQRSNISAPLFNAVLGSIAYLESGSAAGGRRDPAIEQLLIDFSKDPENSASLRTLALRKLPAEARSPSADELRKMISESSDRGLAIEVIRLLSARGLKDSEQVLAAIAADVSTDIQTRADAIASLADKASEYAKLINQAALPKQPEALRIEARRIINRGISRTNADHPKPDDLAAWTELVGAGGDANAGRRVFLRSTCIKCHAHTGRGANTGPDLSTIGGSMTSSRLLESILMPSKEIGPLYVPYKILTVDGKVLTGLKLDGSGAGESMRFQGADGNEFRVAMNDIEVQEPIGQSIMPTGLQESMSIDEFKDLMAFLLETNGP